MRTQENREKYKEYDHKYYIKNRRPKTKIGQLETEIDQLKQQLEESFTEEDVEGLIEDRDKTIKFLQKELAEKDCRIEELESQFAYECECNMQLVDLQKQLEEKQKTIDEINREFVQAVHDWKTLCADKDKEIEMLNAIKNNAIECADLFKVALSVRQKDLAIAELEKIINIFEPYENDNRDTILQLNNNVSFIDYIEQRIKELKGE